MEENNPVLSGRVLLEKEKSGGYHLYRIPAITSVGKETVLCCCEARTSPGDWSAERLFLYRSGDGGRSFEPRRTVAFGSPNRAVHNPVLLPEGGRVHLLWNEEYRRTFHAVSTDEGRSFGEAAEITGAFEGFRPLYDWNICAVGPGHGAVNRAGRLLVPVWLGHGRPLDEAGRLIEHRPTVAGVLYSDDGGDSWRAGGIVGAPLLNANETTCAVLSDGRLLLNIRHESPDMFRALSWSATGADGFSAPVLDRQLPDPMCFGSLAAAGGRSFLFVNCANNDRYPFAERVRLTIRFSDDDCATWKAAALLDERGGYADICVLPDGKTACCFYERQEGERFELYCARLSIDALRASAPQ